MDKCWWFLAAVQRLCQSYAIAWAPDLGHFLASCSTPLKRFPAYLDLIIRLSIEIPTKNKINNNNNNNQAAIFQDEYNRVRNLLSRATYLYLLLRNVYLVNSIYYTKTRWIRYIIIKKARKKPSYAEKNQTFSVSVVEECCNVAGLGSELMLT